MKFITSAELRDLEHKVATGQISFSLMIQHLNEKAEKWHESKINELNKSDRVRMLRSPSVDRRVEFAEELIERAKGDLSVSAILAVTYWMIAEMINLNNQ